jgi:hypothetical protein
MPQSSRLPRACGLPILVCLALVAIDSAAAASDKTKPPAVAQSPPATAPVDASPEELLQRIYGPYLAPGEPTSPIDDDRATLEKTFDDPLVELLLADFACQRREEGICGLDGDPFLDAQDWQLDSLVIKRLMTSLPQPGPQTAVVGVTFNNFGHATAVEYVLVRLDRGWRIHDISYPPGGADHPSLRGLLGAK